MRVLAPDTGSELCSRSLCFSNLSCVFITLIPPHGVITGTAVDRHQRSCPTHDVIAATAKPYHHHGCRVVSRLAASYTNAKLSAPRHQQQLATQHNLSSILQVPCLLSAPGPADWRPSHGSPLRRSLSMYICTQLTAYSTQLILQTFPPTEQADS
ncbi:hypothetical protein C0Q70_09315 [Pomacea canaliculata]|uniref:Uncharacterized protein n=1 Tax=Pomacea canaliculata TaxID=400727 RepID=A0A2T7P9G2_POMCA|nr:hypothetical protein C0Q70_09315 [Pomacea canaliculata]